MRRMRLSIVFFCLLLCANSAYAEEDFGKSAVAQTLRQLASKRRSESDSTVGSRARVDVAPPTPYTYREETPADVDALMARIEEQNGVLVAEFENLLDKDPLNPDAPKWLSQIAEFHYQMAHYAYLRARRAWMAELDTCDEEAGNCKPEPEADYSLAISDYRRLYASYPNYEKMDDVLFRLGDALIRNRQAKEGISYLHKLTQQYPDYEDLDAAYLAMGEYYFSQKNTGTAQAAYRKILDSYPDSTYRQYAEYKLAWTYLNLGDEESYQTAIDLFKSVVESIDRTYASAIGSDGLIDENKLKVGEVSFRNQALNDLSTTYAELPDGWKAARDYLQTKLPPDKALNKIDQLGGILDAQGKYEEEIVLYGELLALHPESPRAVDWYLNRIGAFEASNRLDEAETETRRAIEALLPSGAWYRANASDPQAIATARRWSAERIYSLALKSIMTAEQAKDHRVRTERFADAEQLLQREIEFYLDDVPAFDVYYSYAYVLDELSDMALTATKSSKKSAPSQDNTALLDRLRDAAEVYQKLIDWESPDAEMAEQIRVAANRQVFVYANILATSDPEWSIVHSAKMQNFVEEKRDGQILEKEELTDAERGFVRSAQQYADRYPTDDETPAFLWRAAEIYRSHHDYDQAAQRFDQIISNFPNHEYAAVSVGSMFELYYKADRFDKIEYWAKYMRDRKNFKYYTAQELEDTASFAIDKQATIQAESGHIDEAVATLLRIESSFESRRDLVASARLKAAEFEESRKRYKAAASLLEPITVRSDSGADTTLRAALASYRRAVNLSQIVRYREAADAWAHAADLYFQTFAGETPDFANPLTAKNNAEAEKPSKSKTRQNQRQIDASSSVPTGIDPDSRMNAGLSIIYGAQAYRNLGDEDSAAKLLDIYIQHNTNGLYDICRRGDDIVVCSDESNANPSAASDGTEKQIVANKLSAIAERANLFTSPTDKYTYLSSRLEEISHEGVSAAESRRILLQTAGYAIDAGDATAAQSVVDRMTIDDSWSAAEKAQLAYHKGRCAQLAFEAVELEFPIRVLRKKIEEKAKKRQQAEKFYREAIGYRSASISTAASYALAQMALHFRDAFRQLPPPQELANDPDGLEEYTLWIEDELVFPAEDAAASLLDVARQITLQLESYTTYSLRSARALAELKPDEYPIVEPSVELTSD